VNFWHALLPARDRNVRGSVRDWNINTAFWSIWTCSRLPAVYWQTQFRTHLGVCCVDYVSLTGNGSEWPSVLETVTEHWVPYTRNMTFFSVQKRSFSLISGLLKFRQLSSWCNLQTVEQQWGNLRPEGLMLYEYWLKSNWVCFARDAENVKCNFCEAFGI
jgi:hypothetical protein